MEPPKADDANAAALAAAVAKARASDDLPAAVEALLALEKARRNEKDAHATAKVCVALVELCFERRDLRALSANVLLVSKRRGQLNQAIKDTVAACIGFVERLPRRADRLELIQTLKTVTGAHIFVEVERARVTRMLSLIQEGEGRIAEASETLQEVQVETFGSMDKREKAELILEQMRLCMRQRDFVRMGIIANKINKKVLDEAGFEPLKLRFLHLMALLAHSRHDAPALAKGAMAVLETRGVKDDAEQWRPALASAAVYTALSAWDHETADACHRLQADARLADALPAHFALLKMLTTQELIPWPLPEPHGAALRAHEAFSLDPNTVGATGGAGAELGAAAAAAAAADQAGDGGSGTAVEAAPAPAPAPAAKAAAGLSASSLPASSSTAALPESLLRLSGALASAIVRKEDEPSAQWAEILRKRVVQHNLRVLAAAYSRCRFARLAELLGLDAPTTEAMVSELVSGGAIFAKMDRPAGIVVFERPRPATAVLTDWARDLDEVLSLIDKATHLIGKEQLMAAARSGIVAKA